MADNKTCLGLTVSFFSNDNVGSVALIRDQHCAGCGGHWNSLFYYQQMMTLVNQRRELQTALKSEHDRVLELESIFVNNQPTGNTPSENVKPLGPQLVKEGLDVKDTDDPRR